MRTVRCSGRLQGGRVSSQGVYTSLLPLDWHTCENITFPQLLLRTVIIYWRDRKVLSLKIGIMCAFIKLY